VLRVLILQATTVQVALAAQAATAVGTVVRAVAVGAEVMAAVAVQEVRVGQAESEL